MNDEGISEKPSKSERKRELAELQQLAGQMAALSDGELQRLGVDDALRAALALVRPMRPSGARNRQIKHCVRFMDEATIGDVRSYLEDRNSRQVAANRELHLIEQWRDRLAAEGDSALEDLFAAHPDLDRQQTRHLVRDASREKKDGRPVGAGRKLFRFLRDSLPAQTKKN